MEDNSAYRDLFFEETDTNLEILNEEVLRLEQNPEDKAIVDAIFRAAHTLKGMAATMGYTTMAHLTHALENVFELYKDPNVPVTTDSVSLVFETLDTLTDIVEALRAGEDGEMDISSLVQSLEAVVSGSDEQEESPSDMKPQPEGAAVSLDLDSSDLAVIEEAQRQEFNAFGIAVKVDEESVMKAARAYLVMNKLESEGDIIFTDPSPDQIEEGDFGEQFQLVILTKLEETAIKEMILDISEIEEVALVNLKEGLPKADEKSIEEKDTSLNTSEDNKEKTETKAPKTSASRPVSRQTIRVDLTRLDQFMNLVSELVIHRTRLEDLGEKGQMKELSEPLTQVGRITTELQELVLQLRMQPFNVVVQRFPRMLRDLTNELGKEIQLVTDGEDTELDRTVVSELGEPLIHLLRNAADHGIEMPDEREKAGKPRQGTIKLAAYPEGNRVIVTLSDDGKGLDPVAIKASAEKKGISTDGLSDEEIQQLIFHPGFSTAAKVTGISGRGVGMDAVKEKIGSLNGTIETISVVGEGTTFRITLPLTLSIIQSLLVKAGGETFALPQAVIDKVNVFSEEDAIQVHQREVYRYNGQTIPITRLTQSLGLESDKETTPHVIVVLLGDDYHAVVVDELVQQKEIVIKKLGKELESMKKFLGATILGDGSISLILDLTTICTERKEVTV